MEIPAGFFNVSFNKAMAFGYRTEDVDDFVTNALQITKELQGENETLQRKLEVLASTLENYREEEDSLRSALIGAQKLGDSILKDSRQKAEKIIRDAEECAAQINSDSATAQDKQQYELEQMQAQTVDFKEKLFALYRTHLDIIKNIPADYDRGSRPRAKTPPPAQPAAAPPQEEAPVDEPAVDYQTPVDLPQGSRYDKQSSAEYTHEYAVEQPATYVETVADDYSVPEPEPEPLVFYEEIATEEPEEDYFDSPFVEDDPDSDKLFTVQPPYAQKYDASEEPEEAVAVVEAPQPIEEDDPPVYHAPPRRVDEPHPFTTPPMVQLEFDTGNYDEYDDDEFAAEKKLLREANLNRIPYLDDDDEDDFAVQLTSKKKPVVSQKFGVLKFGDAFDLRDD